MPSSIPTPQRSKPRRNRLPRELCFDLENRPLAYWYQGETTSEITAFAWKWSDEDRVHSMLLDRDGRFIAGGGQVNYSDTAAYKIFWHQLAKADLVYGHNIRSHDLPMLNAGLLRRGLPCLPPLTTADTLKDYPRRKGLSASLENLASMYGLEGAKLKMTQPMWERANRLLPDGVELARGRVVGDVLLQERLYHRTKDLLKPSRVWRP